MIPHPNRPKSRLRGTVAGAMMITAAGMSSIQLVGGFEGLRLAAYRDVVGVWTACYGETKGIKPGMKFSKEACDNLLVNSLIEHEKGMRLCLEAQPNPVNPDSIPINVYIAGVSLTYNIGVGAFCGSTVNRLMKAGVFIAACNSFLKWDKGGKPLHVIKGLTKRRQAEWRFCLKGA